jgi:hypothetical protein
VTVTYETIRCSCDKFGKGFAHRVKAARRKPGSTWRLDEMFVTLRGEPHLLWRAVDEHGAELGILLNWLRVFGSHRICLRATPGLDLRSATADRLEFRFLDSSNDG